MTGMLIRIQKTTSSSQGNEAFQSGMIGVPSAVLILCRSSFFAMIGLPLRYRKRKRTAIVTSPEKTPTSPTADAGSTLTKILQEIPRVTPAMIPGTSPFLTPAMPSAIQSIPSANPVEITGRKSAIVPPSRLTSMLKTEAGRVIGTASSEKEVSGSYPRQGSATAASGENPRASMIGGSIVTGVAPIETRNDPKPTFRIMICSYRSAAITLT
jgi:hypothetical protein